MKSDIKIYMNDKGTVLMVEEFNGKYTCSFENNGSTFRKVVTKDELDEIIETKNYK